MSKSGIIDREDLLAFALPRIDLGVAKVRIAKDYSKRVGFRVTRQAIDYHLEKQDPANADTTGSGANDHSRDAIDGSGSGPMIPVAPTSDKPE